MPLTSADDESHHLERSPSHIWPRSGVMDVSGSPRTRSSSLRRVSQSLRPRSGRRRRAGWIAVAVVVAICGVLTVNNSVYGLVNDRDWGTIPRTLAGIVVFSWLCRGAWRRAISVPGSDL
jgi:hypothetical protein